MTYHHELFYMPSYNDSLVITAKPKADCRVCVTATQTLCIFYLLPHKTSGTHCSGTNTLPLQEFAVNTLVIIDSAKLEVKSQIVTRGTVIYSYKI
jgi:hypothetical protein